MTSTKPKLLICSVDGCKRAVSCLCRHCQKDVCSKHFNEHQSEVNDQLIPVTHRLNELKMRLKMKDDETGPLAKLQAWRDQKYQEIDQEYNRRREGLEKQIVQHDKEISRTIEHIQGLIDEGDVSIDQVKQIEQTIDTLTNQVNSLRVDNEVDLIGREIQMGGIRFGVKARINCQNTDLYALESERVFAGYDGRCPKCGIAHAVLAPNRGMYALADTIHTKIFVFESMAMILRKAPVYLTPNECARQFADDLLENKDIAVSMVQMVSPSDLTSLTNIAELFLMYERSLFLSTLAEIGGLCSEKYYERVHYFIAFLDELMELHSDKKYQDLIEKYLDQIVYADLTDHFVSYPIVLQIQIMAIIESTPILHFPLIHEDSESDQSKIDLFLQDAARYFHNMTSRSLYRRLVFRPESRLVSQQAILHALIIGCIFLPLTCHAAFMNELYLLLSKEPALLSLTNMETFFHVLWPTGINQSYSVARVYLAQLLIVRLMNVEKSFAHIAQICFVIHLRVPNIRVNLMDVIEPLCETEGFQRYLDQQQQEPTTSDQQHSSILDPILNQIRERMKRGFRLKQICRMKIRSILAPNRDQHLLSQIDQLQEISETNRNYLTYNLQGLLNDPEKYIETTQPQNEPVWNSSIPPPPVE